VVAITLLSAQPSAGNNTYGLMAIVCSHDGACCLSTFPRNINDIFLDIRDDINRVGNYRVALHGFIAGLSWNTVHFIGHPNKNTSRSG
jgi:hypothetical protein